MGSKKKIIIAAAGAAVVLCGVLAVKLTGRPAGLAGVLGHSSSAVDIYIDYSAEIGEVNPLNGINNGPASHAVQAVDGSWDFDFDVTQYYKSMNVPIVRLHDTEYPFGSDKFVDIHCIFPDFSADEDDPASYYFEATDAYVAKIVESGAEVMFRLGESIDHTGENRYINEPSDYDKWARVCEHIVRHYNESWNKGFDYDIKYWEIWNEPDNSLMWTGTMDEYCRLYATTAKYLKDKHDDIYIGGPALTGIKEDEMRVFLDGIKAYGDVPLDFFSWHDYNDSPAAFASHADKAREILDEYGYTDIPSILDEWNYIEDWADQTGSIELRSSQKGAAYIAAALMTMQSHGVDMAMYYDGQYEFADYYCGLYGRDGRTKPGYYSFRYWGELMRLGTQVKTEISLGRDGASTEETDVMAVAARSRSGMHGLMIVNYGENAARVRIKTADAQHLEILDIHRVNEKHPDEKVSAGIMLFGKKSITMQPGEVMFISF